VSKVGASTKAGVGCGSCKGSWRSCWRRVSAKSGYDPSEHYYVPGVPLEKSQLVAEIRSRGLKSGELRVQELAGGKEDPASKVGLARAQDALARRVRRQRDARFINDRVHANIQKDGTFSVCPGSTPV
jgi:nitrite reductase (NADH) large subunit